MADTISIQRYAAGALLSLALHQAQIHQQSPVGFQCPSDDEDEAQRQAIALPENEIWASEKFGLLRPVFRHLNIDSKAWPGLEETALSSTAKHHIGAFLRILSEEENGENPSSSTGMNSETELVKAVDAVAVNLERVSISPEKSNEIGVASEPQKSQTDNCGHSMKGPNVACKVPQEACQLASAGKTLDVEERLYEREMIAEGKLLTHQRKIAVLFELLAACVADTPEDGKKKSKLRSGYDARHRSALRLLATWFNIKWIKVAAMEIMVACSAMAVLKERESQEETETDKNKWARWKRGGIIGAAALTGGALLAITGGLAAPAIAAGLSALAPTLGTIIPVVGASGFAAAATAAGSVAGSVAVAASFGGINHAVFYHLTFQIYVITYHFFIMEDRREKWCRVPGSVALACLECNGLITPCIICAHSIPFCGHFFWENCGHCGAINPMQKLERHFLGLSPPSALTPSMVRRVMVAHVGRHQYTRAVQSRYHQLQMAQKGTRRPDREKEESVQSMKDGTDTVSKSMANMTLYDLPFAEYDGILPNYGESDELNKSEIKCTSQCEPLAKRMRITSEDKGLFCLNVEGRNSLSLGNCVEIPKQFAEVSESRCRSTFLLNNGGSSQNPYKQGYGMEEQIKEKDLHRKSDEIKSASEPRGCLKCGSSTSQISKDFLTVEGQLSHTETQLLALHSAESLSSDLHSSVSMYPICGSMHVSAIKVEGAKACVSQCNNICGAPQEFSCFSLHILRLAHSVLASDWEMWLAKSKVNMKQKTIGEVLSCAEQFLQKRKAIFHVQGLLQKALAAQAQSNRDSTALLEHQVYISVGSLLKNVFNERVQERFSAYKKLIEPFPELLEQINAILKFCFSQLRTLFKDPSDLCSLQLSSASKFEASSGETETVAEALRTAVPLWLVLYHDVAHVTVLFQASQPLVIGKCGRKVGINRLL